MAPIVATGSGIVPQTLEDPELRHLLDILHQLPLSISEISNVERLSLLLDPWKEEWLFEEQVRKKWCYSILSKQISYSLHCRLPVG